MPHKECVYQSLKLMHTKCGTKFENLVFKKIKNDFFGVDACGHKGVIRFEVNYIGTSEHSGTRIDAPSYFYRGKLRMHQIPLERLYGPGVIIDVKNHVSRNHGYKKVSISDIRRWETYHGRIPNGAMVLMNIPGGIEANQRSVHAVGSDSPSIYTSPSSPPEFSGFVVLFKRNIPVVLSVANVDRLPSSGSTVFLPAINIYDGSGAPVRIFAIVPVSKMRY
ncbi:unnamed protein product [Mytilus coruscus]|uniref:Uncharacterized protein n=1 Tax=Mytilus coruscus TaxID=42192 RepID=A0A6J8DQA1_MYTCO|nr:unnamed protein product [Mytilus coruscus]